MAPLVGRAREGHPLRISLLQATYHASHATDTRAAWLEAAAEPELVEHIFALDADDEIALSTTGGHLRVVGPPSPDRVSAVRNWNAAARVATGDLLFVIADDLRPPPQWDLDLHHAVKDLDWNRCAFVISVDDRGSGSRSTLLRHPVVSRGFYEKFGLFDPDFSGLFCDDDLTVKAYSRALVLDGSSIKLDHAHPTLNDEVEWSTSQRRMNADREYREGEVLFRRKWSAWARHVDHRPFEPAPGMVNPGARASLWRTSLRIRGPVRHAVHRLGRKFRGARNGP